MINIAIKTIKWFFSLSPKKRITYVSKGQQECHNVLKELFPKNIFKTVRPDFLQNPKTKRNLELDLYCEELKLAIEYNGAQHYFFSPHYHPTLDHFEKQKYRDQLKKRLCKKNKIILIVVPHTVTDIRMFITKKLYKKKIIQINNSCIIV